MTESSVTLPPVRQGTQTMDHPNQTRIMQNGAGWYWEVVTNDHGVVARGISDTHAQARADAEKANLQIRVDTRLWSGASPSTPLSA